MLLHCQEYGRAGCVPFYRQHYGCALYCAGCVSFHSQQNGRAACNHFESQEYERAVCMVYAFTLPGVWTYRVCPFLSPVIRMCRVYPFLNDGLSGIRNGQKFRCRNQSGTGIRGPSPVPECSGTGLRYRMSECRWHRHR
jgi:hypothetical protein